MGQRLVDLQTKTNALETTVNSLNTTVSALNSKQTVDSYTKADVDSKLITAAGAAILDTVTLQSDGKLRIRYKSGIEQTILIPEGVGTPVSAQLAVYVPYVLQRSGWDYTGNDLGAVQGTLEQCGTRCNNTTGCVGFGRRDSDNMCWLKNQATGGVQNANIDYYRPPTSEETTVATATNTLSTAMSDALNIKTTLPF